MAMNLIITNKMMKINKKRILFPAAILILAILALIAWFLYSGDRSLEHSKHFDRDFVDQAVYETAQLLIAEDIETLQAISTDSLKPQMTLQQIQTKKSEISSSWGNVLDYGIIYTHEERQDKQYYAVGEMEVTFEHVTVKFRVKYEESMFLHSYEMEKIE